MKTIHYTPNGYNGDYTHTTACAKDINTHKEEDQDVSIDPIQTTCKDCIESKTYRDDLRYAQGNLDPDVKRRIFIESDILQKNEFKSAQRDVRNYLEEKEQTYVPRIFSEVLDFAWHDLEKTWEAVKKADEIYADSSFLPLCGGAYMGAPVIVNGMCERAIKEGVTGKSVYILNKLENINWYMIEEDLFKKAFQDNKLYMYDDEYEMVHVDVKQIKFN